jgi:hypothetical protein
VDGGACHSDKPAVDRDASASCNVQPPAFEGSMDEWPCEDRDIRDWVVSLKILHRAQQGHPA